MPALLLKLLTCHQFHRRSVCEDFGSGLFLFPVKISLTIITIIDGYLFQTDTKIQNTAKMRKCLLHVMPNRNILVKQNEFRIPPGFRESSTIPFVLLEFCTFTNCNEKVCWIKHDAIFASARCTLV